MTGRISRMSTAGSDIDLAPLDERQHALALGSVQPHARCGLLEGANNLITGALGKGGQIPLLTLAGLVGG